MKEKPLVSVVLPCYNALPYLENALFSIMHQTYHNIEIICIDDGSTDDTLSFLEYCAQIDNRVKVIRNEQNMGLIRTLNKALQFCQGDYIARMDADDISSPFRIEKELNYLLSNPEIDLVSCANFFISEKGKLLGIQIVRQKSYLANYFASFFYTPIGHPEILCKKKILADNTYLFNQTTIHVEDYELWVRLLNNKYQLCNIDEPLHALRINTQSVSRKYTDVQDYNFTVIVKQHISSYLNTEITFEIACVIANRMNSDVTLQDLKEGFRIMKKLKNTFLLREKIFERETLKEIEVVYYTHLFDVSIQAMKKLSFYSKCYALVFMFRNILGLFYGKVFVYLLNKMFVFSYFFARKKFSRLFPEVNQVMKSFKG